MLFVKKPSSISFLFNVRFNLETFDIVPVVSTNNPLTFSQSLNASPIVTSLILGIFSNDVRVIFLSELGMVIFFIPDSANDKSSISSTPSSKITLLNSPLDKELFWILETFFLIVKSLILLKSLTSDLPLNMLYWLSFPSTIFPKVKWLTDRSLKDSDDTYWISFNNSISNISQFLNTSFPNFFNVLGATNFVILVFSNALSSIVSILSHDLKFSNKYAFLNAFLLITLTFLISNFLINVFENA